MKNFSDFIDLLLDLVNTTIPVISALALLAFFYGLARFIARVGGDEKAVTEGKSFMVWGLVALFVMVSFKAIIIFFSNDLGFTFGMPLLPGK
jgi:hypothetical protein